MMPAWSYSAHMAPCGISCISRSVGLSLELKRIVKLLSGYPDPNSSRIMISSVFYLYPLNLHI